MIDDYEVPQDKKKREMGSEEDGTLYQDPVAPKQLDYPSDNQRSVALPHKEEKPKGFQLNPSDDVDTFIKRYSDYKKVPSALIKSLRNQESSNGKNTHNAQTGASGDFQYLKSTANAEGIDPDDPFQAAAATINSFADRFKKYRPQSESDDHTWQRVIASHYTGEPNVDESIKAKKYLPETYNTDNPNDPTTPEYVSQVWDRMNQIKSKESTGAQVVQDEEQDQVNEEAFKKMKPDEREAWIAEQTRLADEKTPLQKGNNPLTSGIEGQVAGDYRQDSLGGSLGSATIHADDPAMVYQQKQGQMSNPVTEINKDQIFNSFLTEANQAYDKGRQSGDYSEYKKLLQTKQFAPIQFVSQAQDAGQQQQEIEQAVRAAAQQVSADPLETEHLIAEMRAKGDGSIHIYDPTTGEERVPEPGKPFQVSLSGEQAIRLRKHALAVAEDKKQELEEGISPTQSFLGGLSRSLSFNGLANYGAGKVVSIFDDEAGKTVAEFGYDPTKNQFFGAGTRPEDYGIMPGTSLYNKSMSKLQAGEMAGTIVGEISKLIAAHKAIGAVGKFLSPPVRALLSPMVDRFATIPGSTSITTAIGGEFVAQNALKESASLITERLSHILANSAAIAGINISTPEIVKINFNTVNKSLDFERGIASTEVNPDGSVVFHKEGWADVGKRFSRDFAAVTMLGAMSFPISKAVQVTLENPAIRAFVKPAWVGIQAERGVGRLDAEIQLNNALTNPVTLNVLSSTIAGAVGSYSTNPDMDWFSRIVDIGSQSAQAYLTRAGSLLGGRQPLGDFYVKHSETGEYFKATVYAKDGGVEFSKVTEVPKGSEVFEPVTKPELDLYSIMLASKFGTPEQKAKLIQVESEPAPIPVPKENNVQQPTAVTEQPGTTAGEPGAASSASGAEISAIRANDATSSKPGGIRAVAGGSVQSAEPTTASDVTGQAGGTESVAGSSPATEAANAVKSEPIETRANLKDRIVNHNGQAVQLTGEVVTKGQSRFIKALDKTGKETLVSEDQAERKNPMFRIQTLFSEPEENQTPEKRSFKDRVKLAMTRYGVDRATAQFDVTDLGNARTTEDNTLYLDPVSSRDLSKATELAAKAGVFESPIDSRQIGAFNEDAAKIRKLADFTDNPRLKSALLELKNGQVAVIDSYATERALSGLHEGIHGYAVPFQFKPGSLEALSKTPEILGLRKALETGNSYYKNADDWTIAHEALAFGLTGDSETLKVDKRVLAAAAQKVLRQLVIDNPEVSPEVLKKMSLDAGKKIIRDFKNNAEEAPKAGFSDSHTYGRWKQGVIEETIKNQPDVIAEVHENPAKFNEDYSDSIPITERRALISDVTDIKRPFLFAKAVSKQIGDLQLYDINKDGKGLYAKANGDLNDLKKSVLAEGFDGYFVGNPDLPFQIQPTLFDNPAIEAKIKTQRQRNIKSKVDDGTTQPTLFRSRPEDGEDFVKNGSFVLMSGNKAQRQSETGTIKTDLLREDLIRKGFTVYDASGKTNGRPEDSLMVITRNADEVHLLQALAAKYKQGQIVVSKNGNYSAPYTDGTLKESFSKSGEIITGNEALKNRSYTEVNLPSGKIAFSVPDLFDSERSSRPSPKQEKIQEAIEFEAKYAKTSGFSSTVADRVSESPQVNSIGDAFRSLDKIYSKKFPRKEKVSEPEQIARFIGDWIGTVKSMLDDGLEGKHWYSDDLDSMYQTLDKEFPGIATSDAARLAFSTMLAVTSPRQSVRTNFEAGKNVFKRFLETIGKSRVSVPVTQESGEQYGVFTRGLRNLDKLYNGHVWSAEKGRMVFSPYFRQQINERGMAAVFDYMTQPGTSREYVAQELFGYKVGSFLMNLHGNTQIPTVDSWMARAWKLNNGEMFKPTGELNDAVSPQLGNRIRGSIQSISARLNAEGYKVTPVEIQAMIWTHLKSITESMTGRKSISTFDDAARRSLQDAPKDLVPFWKKYGTSLTEANPEAGAGEYIRRAKAKSRILFRSDEDYARDLRDDVFYSQLDKQLDEKMSDTFTVQQLQSFLKNPKQAIKADEVKWSGVEDYLADKNPSDVLNKEEVRNYINENRTKIYEFDSAEFQDQIDVRQEYRKAQADIERLIGARHDWDDYNRQYGLSEEYPDSNRLELEDAFDRATVLQKSIEPQYAKMRGAVIPKMEGYAPGEISEDFTASGGDNYRAVLLKAAGIQTHQKHFFDTDSIAHARLTDRTIDGKSTLHIEELQSDHHQQGRDYGYKTIEEAARRKEQRKPTGEAVSDAPLRKTWHEAMFKRLVMQAANEDYQQISWTSGDVHNKRYGFAEDIKGVTYDPKIGKLTYYDVDGGQNVVTDIDPSELKDYLDPITADRLGRQDERQITPGGLWKVTGEGKYMTPESKGMKQFYDGTLTSYAKSMARKFGSEVRETKLVDTEGNKHNVYTMDVTPQMKDRMPLFRTEETPESTKTLLDAPAGELEKHYNGIGIYRNGDGSRHAVIQGDDGKPIVGASVADVGGKIRITDMSISEEMKGTGASTMMLDRLRKQYPGIESNAAIDDVIADSAGASRERLFRTQFPSDEDGWVETAKKLKGISLTTSEETTVRAAFQHDPSTNAMVATVAPFKVSIPEFLLKVYKAGLLSGISTTATNLASNASMIAMEELTKVPVAILDIAVSYASGADRSALLPSPKAWYDTLSKGIPEGWSAFIDALKNGNYDNFYQIPAQSGIPILDKTVGKLSDYVFRFLGGQDKIFKAVAFRRTMYEQRRLEEKAGGRKMDDTAADPQRDLAQADLALRTAAYVTFQKDNFISDKYIQAKGWAQQNMMPLSWYLDMKTPFVKTGTNVALNAVDYMGITGVARGIHHLYNAVDPKSWTVTKKEVVKIIDDPETRREIQELSGRGMVGAALTLAGYKLAQAALITLDYDDKDKKQLNEMGERNAPFLAVKVGDRFVPFTRLMPLGAFFAAGAKMYHDRDAGLNKNIADVGRMLVGQFPLGKFQDQVMNDKAKATDLLLPTGNSMIPSIVRDFARYGDVKRETKDRDSVVNTFINQLYSSVPGLRKKLPVKTTALGYNIDEGDTVLGTTKARQTKLVNELSRLNWFPAKFGVDPKGGFKERPLELRIKIRESLEKVVDSPEYEEADDALKSNLLQKTTGILLDEYAKENKDEEMLERRRKKSEQTKQSKSVIKEILGR